MSPPSSSASSTAALTGSDARSPPPPLDELGQAWRDRVAGSRVRAGAAAGAVLLFAAFLVARRGTDLYRLFGVGAIAVPAAVALWGWTYERALWRDPARTIRRLAGRLDRDRADRAIRALSLVSDQAQPGTSPELARAHVARTLGALPRDRILARALTVAGRYAWVTLGFAAVALALAATRGFAIFEGADVLLAAKRQGLVPIRWIDLVDIAARPPEYLHEHDLTLDPYDGMALPRGSTLTYRGVPLHAGRRLLLTDGATEVPFVDDGTGRVVARWPLTASVRLRVVARFGEVTIVEPDVTPILSVEDEVPLVTLDGAPRLLRLTDVGVGAKIPIKYEATDDHGLREVHLVLRSGAREDRRVLTRLDGEAQSSRGGHVLLASDPFIKKSHAPVEIRVEAQDNDTVTGPKWGSSDAITIIPPEAGEPEALRLDVLRALRDGLVDSLAGVLDRSFAVPVPERTKLADADRESIADDDRLLDVASAATPAGLQVPRRDLALLRGQMRRVKEALNAELHSPGTASHGRLVGATEHLVLVTDAILRRQAQADARVVARSLADVADDLALGAAQQRRPQDKERGKVRADASVQVLEGGARSLARLGSLGRDLGEIVGMDLSRVGRARDQDDLVHAEIAASDLAARLRDPDPSFGAHGSSGGRAGGESGGGRGAAGGTSAGDDAEQQAFNESENDLERLKDEHAEEIRKVDSVMNEEPPKVATEEAKRHAKAVRDGTRGLPSVGAGSDSWTNKGAAAREHAEAMARALEEGDTGEAVANGRSALDALDEARKLAQRERWTSQLTDSDDDADRSAVDKHLQAIRDRLEPELAWASEALKDERKEAAMGKLPDLSARGEEEGKLAEKAGKLRDRGEGQGVLPAPALEALHQAERAAEEAAAALKRGDVDEGQARQREAQRRLESASEAMGHEGAEEAAANEGAEGASAGHTDIPGAAASKGADDFRRRVVEGLAQGAAGRQKDAIRRYADGLLR